MSVTTIEVLPDISQPAGGHAIIRLKGVALLPPGAVFHITPIDDTLSDTVVGGWPLGDLKPLSTRQTPEGIELRIGPDIVDAPLLEPGTPVTISVPDGCVSAELVWPDLPMSSGRVTAPFVMTPSQMAAELAATERSKIEAANAVAETTRAAQATVKRAKAAAQAEDRASIELAMASGDMTRPNLSGTDRLAAAARELEAALALEGDPHRPEKLATKPAPLKPAATQATAPKADTQLGSDARYSGTLTSEALSALANTTGANASGTTGQGSIAQGTAQAERQRGNAASLSSLKTAPDRADPLVLQSEREMSLPTIILKHAHDQASVGPGTEPTRLRREPTIDGHIATDTLFSRLMPFLAGAGVAGIAAAAVFAVIAVRSVTSGAPVTGAEWAQSAAGRKATLAEAFTVGTQSPRGEIASDVDLSTALRLADHNLHGIDRPIDRAEAEFWLKKAMSLTASHSQIRWAMTQLGTLSAEPVTGNPDYEKARLLWEIAAANGDPVALCFLGTLAENGLGLAVDRSKALEYFKQSKAFGGCPNSDESIARLSK